MSDKEALWVSNEGTRVYRVSAGETIQMKRVGRWKKPMDMTVTGDGMIVAEEFIPLEEISDATSRIVISFYAVYFVEILLKSGERILVYHIQKEGTMSEIPQNLDTYLFLVALCEMRNVDPPPFENPQTRGKWTIRLILFWAGIIIVGIVTRGFYLIALASIPLFLAGYIILNDGLKYRTYEGGKNLAWGGLALSLLAIFLYILVAAMIGVL